MKIPSLLCYLAIITVVFGCYANSNNPAKAGIAAEAGRSLKPAPGVELVQRECTLCHAEKLITQNRASRDGWMETIQWMQESQNLREFSAAEEKAILDYLSENHAPPALGRRPPLMIRDWYVLEP